MLYVYAAVRHAPPGRSLDGLDGRPVEMLEAGEIDLAVSAHDANITPTRERLLQHYRVNMALLGVPFRFGNAVAGEKELRELMMPRTGDLARKLEKLAGCVEFTVKLRQRPVADTTPGRAYLLAKRELYARGQELRSTLEGLTLDVREELRQGELSVTWLIKSEDVAAFKECARSASGEEQLQMSGPWPPSSFV